MNHIRYIDYSCSHGADFRFSVPQGHDCWLLLLTNTPALFQSPEGLVEYPAGSAVLFSPHSPIFYQATGGRYENDWVRFDSDELYVTSLPVQNIPFSVVDYEYIHSLFKLLTWEHSFGQGEKGEITSSLFHVLFSKLRSCCVTADDSAPLPHYQDLLLLRKQLVNNPQENWTVRRMAQMLHLSDGYLEDIYHRAFGVSCLQDVITCRIDLAKDQLLYSGKSITQVAEFCGYNNIEHFSRQFRRVAGKSPMAFRKDRG